MRSEQAYSHTGPTEGASTADARRATASDAARSGNFAASVAASAGAHARHGLRVLALLALAGTFALAFSGCDLFPSSASSFSGTKYAVIVGINDYINSSVNDLSYCVADADSMQEMLEDAGWTVTLLTAESNESTNQYATKAAIEAALAAVPSDTATFLFYYSGHGSIDSSDDAYIVPSDFDGSTYASMISATEFSGWLDAATATNKLVILDSCYSGGFVDSGDSVDSISDIEVQQGPFTSTSISMSSAMDMFFRFGELLAQNAAAASSGVSTAPLVISAAGWAEESLEDYPSGNPLNRGINHGYFTYYFLQSAETNSDGRMKGDSDSDNVLSCIEAYNYAKTKILADSDISENEKFIPHISGGLRDFALIDHR
jgi:uncharacterized caspase-like protein